MKDYEEMAKSVLSRRDNYVMERKKRMRKVVSIGSCFCLMLLVGVGIWHTQNSNETSTHNQEEFTTHVLGEEPAVDEVEVVEVNGVKYVVCGKGEEAILQECGISTELTKDLAGNHVCYLGVIDNCYTPVEKADTSIEENDIELFEYAPEPNKNIYIMYRSGEYFAAIRKDDSAEFMKLAVEKQIERHIQASQLAASAAAKSQLASMLTGGNLREIFGSEIAGIPTETVLAITQSQVWGGGAIL